VNAIIFAVPYEVTSNAHPQVEKGYHSKGEENNRRAERLNNKSSFQILFFPTLGLIIMDVCVPDLIVLSYAYAEHKKEPGPTLRRPI